MGVTAACHEVGISRTLYYRWRQRFERYGPAGLHPQRRPARPASSPPATRPAPTESPGWCRVLSAAAAAAFLRQLLGPLYRRAGWRLQRVLTDGGPEFRGAFDEVCRQLGIHHTRTQPRHAWTNGFVERLQGTILQEHWRVAFRRRYFTSRRALQRSLDAFMRYYNHHRPHQGYRLRGQTPAALFWGAAKA